jgi:uncharacterized membrane protein YfcA
MPSPAILVLIGLVTGVLSGMLGAGGGFTTVALLVATGTAAHEAVGTSVVFTAFVAACAATLHFRQHSARPALAVALGAPGVLTALYGARLAASLSDRTLTLGCGLLTALVAVALMARRVAAAPAPAPAPVLVMAGGGGEDHAAPDDDAPNDETGGFEMTRSTLVLAVLGGAAIGVLRGVFGFGGGTLLVPFMVMALGVPEHEAVGTSLMALLPGAIAGAIGHVAVGDVSGPIVALLLVGALPASVVGARLHTRVSSTFIRRTFVAVLVVTAAYLILTSV